MTTTTIDEERLEYLETTAFNKELNVIGHAINLFFDRPFTMNKSDRFSHLMVTAYVNAQHHGEMSKDEIFEALKHSPLGQWLKETKEYIDPRIES
jgi:hypothetical protein